MNIGILLPNWIGDLAMATPALRALRKRFPTARLTGVVRPYAAAVLEGNPWLDQLLSCDHLKPNRATALWRMVSRLRRERFDTLVLLRHSFSAAAYGWLAGAPRRIGYRNNHRQALLTDVIEPPLHNGKMAPHSAVDAYLKITGHLGCETNSRELEIFTTPQDEAAADGVWQRLRLPPAEQVVVLNTGGAFGGSKRWSPEQAGALARLIAENLGLGVLIHCGPNERDDAFLAERLASHKLVKSLAHEARLPLGLSKACLRRSRLLVTTDSGPRHLAAGLGTPTITLFGPIDPAWSHNYQPDAISLREPLACSPCGKPVCPLKDHPCMRNLTPERVFAAVRAQLDSRRKELAAA